MSSEPRGGKPPRDGAGLEFRRIGAWRVAVLALPHGQSDDLACLLCGSPVELHQPDPERPTMLLGTCHSCGAWHVLAATAAGLETLALDSPEEAGTGPDADRA